MFANDLVKMDNVVRIYLRLEGPWDTVRVTKTQ